MKEIRMKEIKEMKESKYIKIIAAGAFHYPYIAKQEFARWIEFIKVFKPEKIFLLGSLIHSKRSLRALSVKTEALSDEIIELNNDLDEFRKNLLMVIRKAAGKAQIYYLEGTTEKNLRKWCEHQNLHFEETVLKKLRLNELGIEYVSSGKINVSKFQFTHGLYALKRSVSSAKAELNDRGISGCSCISHHIASHYKTNYRGMMVWHEIGSMCQDGIYERKSTARYQEKGFLAGWFSRKGHYFNAFPIRLDEDIVYKKGKKQFIFFDPEFHNGKHQIRVKIGCVHVPYEHKPSLKAILTFLREAQPNKIVLNGDLIDFPSLSHYKDAKNPHIQASLAKNLKKARKLLAQIREICPKAIIVYNEGNHEARIKAYLLENAPVFYGLPDLTIPRLLKLSELGIRWIPAHTGRKEYQHLTFHGDIVRTESGYTALAEITKKGISTDTNHTHRLGKACITDETGTREGNEMGSVCDYGKTPGADSKGKANWQRGFGYTRVDFLHGKRIVRTILVPVVNGKISFFGKDYFSEKKETKKTKKTVK